MLLHISNSLEARSITIGSMTTLLTVKSLPLIRVINSFLIYIGSHWSIKTAAMVMNRDILLLLYQLCVNFSTNNAFR